MRYVKTVTATPLRQDESICTLMANSGYMSTSYENALTTGHFPSTFIVEVWECEEGEDVDNSADEFIKYIRCCRFRGQKIVNRARRKILDAVNQLQPNQFIRLRHLTPTEALYFMGVNKSDAEKMESVNSDAQIYKQAGNSIVVDVLEKIFENMFINRDSNNNLFTSKHTSLMKKITNKQDVQDVYAQLPKEYAKKLSEWWSKAQKPNKPYVIEYEDIEDLAAKIDDHCKKAEQRSQTTQKRQKRQKEKAADSKKLSPIEEAANALAQIRGVKVSDIISDIVSKLTAEANEAQEHERQKVEMQMKQLRAKMRAFENEHIDIINEWAAMESEEKHLHERAVKLNVTTQKLF